MIMTAGMGSWHGKDVGCDAGNYPEGYKAV